MDSQNFGHITAGLVAMLFPIGAVVFAFIALGVTRLRRERNSSSDKVTGRHTAHATGLPTPKPARKPARRRRWNGSGV